MSNRNKLAAIIMSPESFDSGPASCGPNPVYAHRIADAILAAGYRKPRTITTVEELKTVYAGCLIRESGGDLWSVDGATDRLFMIVDGADDTYDDDILTLPATVLWEPLP